MSFETEGRESFGRRGFDHKLEDEAFDNLRASEKQAQLQEPNAVRWIRNHLDEIDLKMMREIFSQIARKSGVSDENQNFIGRERILLVSQEVLSPDGMYFMSYAPNANAININAAKVTDLLIRSKNQTPLSYAFLSSLVHEYTHAMGANVKKERGKEASLQTGYFHQGMEKRYEDRHIGRLISAYSLFNEGMTVLIERQVTAEYLKRKPMALGDGDEILSSKMGTTLINEGKFKLHPTYEAAVTFVERFIHHLADSCELPEDVMRNALIAGYFSGSTFHAEGAELIDQVMGESFLVALTDAVTETDLEKIASTYEFPPTTISLKDAVLKLFPQFRNMLGSKA